MINIKIAKSIKCNGDCSLFITFNYNSDIVTSIKNICSERFYNRDKKEWEVPYKYFDELNSTLSIIDRIHLIEDYTPEVKEHIDLPPSFQFKTTPYDYQKVGIDYGLNNETWLLGDEQGLGKTKQVIDIAVARKQLYGYKHCLIVCCVNSLKWNWVNEIHTHSNEKARVLGQRVKKGKLVVDGNKDKLADIQELSGNDLDEYFLITNIETLRSEEIVAVLSKACTSGRISMIAVDEFHKCLDYDTSVLTDNGYLKIGDIVTNKQNVSVYSYNEDTQRMELKPVVDWHENVVVTPMLKLRIETKSGIQEIKCTPDHKILTSNRGWVEAQNLTTSDDIVEY